MFFGNLWRTHKLQEEAINSDTVMTYNDLSSFTMIGISKARFIIFDLHAQLSESRINIRNHGNFY